MNEPLAIVDVETTGMSALYGRIIEIGILRVENGKVKRTFSSLVNPDCYIHPMIEQLTGISNRDVEDAPSFSAIAREVSKVLAGAVFVAHNARFDYGFLKAEFARTGREFSPRCLCTMRLSRRLFPQHRHHDLNSLIDRHGITCPDRHRALGDARAVYEFLRCVEEKEDSDRVAEAIRHVMKEKKLPVQLDRAMLADLPDTSGVYLFYGPQNELLYVGKSKNIRGRVQGHFAGDDRSAKGMEMCRQVHRIETRTTAGELGALLLESSLIKELHPIYNRMSRSTRRLILARKSTTREGYLAVALEKTEQIASDTAASILAVFKSQRQAEEFLRDAAKEHRLCHKLIGLESKRGPCFGYQIHTCDGACIGEEPALRYNMRVEAAFSGRKVKAWPYKGPILVAEQTPDGETGEAFLVDNWCLIGSGRFADGAEHFDRRPSQRFDYDTYKILFRFINERSHGRMIRNVPEEMVYPTECAPHEQL
jgi:DNA polymerase III subunit epsilon